MRVTEALLRQNRQKKQKNKEDDGETQCYQKRNSEYWALNQKKQIYPSPLSEGINTRENIFDKNAVFKTSN